MMGVNIRAAAREVERVQERITFKEEKGPAVVERVLQLMRDYKSTIDGY